MLVREVVGGVIFAARILEGAQRDTVLGSLGDAVQISVSASADPEETIVRLLSEKLGVLRQNVSVYSGISGRLRMVRVDGVSSAEVSRCFAPEEA